MTFRPDFQVPWAGHAGVTLITLSRLDRTESVQLAGLLAPSCRRCCSTGLLLRADGVPLFIEELTKDWVEARHDPRVHCKHSVCPPRCRGRCWRASIVCRMRNRWPSSAR